MAYRKRSRTKGRSYSNRRSVRSTGRSYRRSSGRNSSRGRSGGQHTIRLVVHTAGEVPSVNNLGVHPIPGQMVDTSTPKQRRF